MKALKIIGGVLLGLAALVVIAVVILVTVVDLNDYKKQIEALAAQQKVQLKIEGDLGWSFYPNLGIRSGQLTVLPPMDNLAAPIAFESLRVGLKLMPLLLRQEVHTSVLAVRGGTVTLKGEAGAEPMAIRQLHLAAQDLNLQQQPFSMELALEVSGGSLPQPASITINAEGILNSQQSVADLSSFRLKVDDTTLQGTIKAAYGEKPFYQINLKGDRINLDRYSKSDIAPDDGKVDSTSGKKAGPEPLIPATLVLAFPGEYRFAFDELVAKHLTLTDFSLALDVSRDGVAHVKPLKAKFYEGDLLLESTVDVRGTQPSVKTQLSITPLQLEPALKDFLQVEKAFASGDFSVKSDVTTRGQTMEDFIRALEGNFSFVSKAITLNQVDLTSSLDASLLQLLQTKLPALASAENKTVLSELAGEGLIQQGIVKPSITAKALCTRFQINGAYDLPDSEVDMRVDITFPSADTTTACVEINPRLKDVAWPVVCKGSLSGDPAKLCAADMKGIQTIAANMAKQEAGQKLNKKLDETLDKKLGQDAEATKQLLKGLFR